MCTHVCTWGRVPWLWYIDYIDVCMLRLLDYCFLIIRLLVGSKLQIHLSIPEVVVSIIKWVRCDWVYYILPTATNVHVLIVHTCTCLSMNHDNYCAFAGKDYFDDSNWLLVHEWGGAWSFVCCSCVFYCAGIVCIILLWFCNYDNYVTCIFVYNVIDCIQPVCVKWLSFSLAVKNKPSL